jgi:glycosyltransferase involved in cell wall biosynthesis
MQAVPVLMTNKNVEKKNNIVFFISSLGGGGAEGVCVSLANALAKRGWQVNLLVLNLNNAVHQMNLDPLVEIVSLNVQHTRNAILPLKKYIKKANPDKFLVFNYELAVLLVLLRGWLNLDYKIIARNINSLRSKQQQVQSLWRKCIVYPLIHRLYYKVDLVINQCSAMQEELIGLYPQISSKSVVIYNPVNSHILEAAKNTSSTHIKKGGYLLCVGRLEKQKAFHLAIKGFAILAEDFPTLKLKILGEGRLENELKLLAVNLNIQDRVDFVGYQKNMIPIYQQANATVLTSLYEGFPNVLVESITLGTPVIAFDCPSGPSEIVEEGINGSLVKSRDTQALTTAIKNVLINPPLPEQVQQNTDKYDIENIVVLYEKVLLIS